MIELQAPADDVAAWMALGDDDFDRLWRMYNRVDSPLSLAVRNACVERAQEKSPWVADSVRRAVRVLPSTPAYPVESDSTYLPAVSRAIDWANLAHQTPPPREWAIPGWLGYGHLTLCVGHGGIGKTLLAQQIASSLALGMGEPNFLGELAAPARVLMWGCEDDHDEFWRRQNPIAASLGVGLDAFGDNLHIHPRHGMENTLYSLENGRMLWSSLRKELREQAGDLRADVVILDNVAQLFGGNENDRYQVTSFINGLNGTLHGAAIMLLAHPARAAGSEFAGSGSWENAARNRWYLGSKLPDDKSEDGAAPEDNVRYLARRKSNYSAKDWRRFTYQDGVLVPDAIEAGGGLLQHLRSKKAETVIMRAARQLRDKNLRFTDGLTSPDYLPRKVWDYKLSEGCNKSELAEAMKQAILDGKLVREVVGQNANRTPQYGLVVHE